MAAELFIEKNEGDDWWEEGDEDEGFIGYVPTAIDPGIPLFVVFTFLCFSSIAVVPCLVVLGRRYEDYRDGQKARREEEREERRRQRAREAEEGNGGVEKRKSFIPWVGRRTSSSSSSRTRSRCSDAAVAAVSTAVVAGGGSDNDDGVVRVVPMAGPAPYGPTTSSPRGRTRTPGAGPRSPSSDGGGSRMSDREDGKGELPSKRKKGGGNNKAAAASEQMEHDDRDETGSAISDFLTNTLDAIAIPPYPDPKPKRRRRGRGGGNNGGPGSTTSSSLAGKSDYSSAPSSVPSSSQYSSTNESIGQYSTTSSFVDAVFENRPRRAAKSKRRGRHPQPRARATEKARRREAQDEEQEEGDQLMCSSDVRVIISQGQGGGVPRSQGGGAGAGGMIWTSATENSSSDNVDESIELQLNALAWTTGSGGEGGTSPPQFSSSFDANPVVGGKKKQKKHEKLSPETLKKLPTLRSGYVENYSHPTAAAAAAVPVDPSERSFVSKAGSSVKIGPMDAPDAYAPEKPHAFHAHHPSYSNKVGGNTVGKEGDDQPYTICCGPRALWRPTVIRESLDKFVGLFEYDREMHRIVKLTIPYTTGTMIEAIFEAVNVALISYYLGTDSVVALGIADTFMEMTTEFIGGVIDAMAVLVSHAMGTGNNYLAGQYVQQAAVTYTIGLIPLYWLWFFAMEPLILWFGFSEHVAIIGRDYARLAMLLEWFDGMAECLDGLYEVTDHEYFSMFVGAVEEIVMTIVTAMVVMYYDAASLPFLVMLDIASSIIRTVFSFVYGYKKRWLDPYLKGMFGNCAMKNGIAYRNLARTALPLSIGEMLAYGEWEILTIFAAYMGPAEVAAWTLMGYVEEILDETSEGIGDAAEVRVSFHLGRGRPQDAERSAYKAMLVAMIITLMDTSILFIIGEDLPKIFTADPTLQHMMVALVPWIGIADITMTFGMSCWNLIGAQGRYSLATKVATFCSWFITMPLAAFFTFYFEYNLEGLVAASGIGYCINSTMLSYILLRSDWARLSKVIQEINAENFEVVSVDSDEESSSSSSSSSSRSSSSDDSSSDDESAFEVDPATKSGSATDVEMSSSTR